jgi:hypothetical protein
VFEWPKVDSSAEFLQKITYDFNPYILKKFIIFLLLLGGSTAAYCQVQFQKLFGHPQSNVTEFVYDSAIDSWGNLYIVGSNSLVTFNITKVDSSGNTIWMKSVNQGVGATLSIVYTHDSSLVISGVTLNPDGYLIKIDTSANIIWSKSFNISSFGKFFNFLIEDQKFNLLLGGHITEYDSITFQSFEKAFLTKFDDQGNLIWEKHLSGPYTSRFNDIKQNEKEQYLLLGTVGNNYLGETDALLLELDTTGNIIQNKIFGSTTFDYGLKLNISFNQILLSINDDNGTSIIKPHFIKLDSLWNITLSNKINLNTTGSVNSIIPWKNQSYLIAANGPMIYIIDSLLNFQSGYNYGPSGFNRTLKEAHDIGENRIFACGVNTQQPDILVIRTNDTLDAGCYSFNTISFSSSTPVILTDSISLSLIDTLFPTWTSDSILSNPWQENMLCNSLTSFDNFGLEPEIVNLYPNPTTDILTINHPSRNIDFLNVMDIYGKICKVNFERNNFKSISIKTKELKLGIYLLSIQISQNIIKSYKFIIQ